MNRAPLAFAAVLNALALVAGCASVPNAAANVPIRVAAYNVRHGAGLDGVVDLERTAAVLRALDADVIALQEVDLSCGRTGGVDQAARLGELCGMEARFGAFMQYDGGDYGMALLARRPILACDNLRLPDGTEPRTALVARVDLDGIELVIAGIHLYETEPQRLAQAETLLAALAPEDAPVVLIGDFNSLRGDPVMMRLEALFENPRKTGEPNTFPADAPEREIDFALFRPAERFTDARVTVVDERAASDHRPIVLDAVLVR